MTEATMPKLSMNMSRGTVTEWFVEDGDAVEEGENLLEVESEKATSVLEAPLPAPLIERWRPATMSPWGPYSR